MKGSYKKRLLRHVLVRSFSPRQGRGSEGRGLFAPRLRSGTKPKRPLNPRTGHAVRRLPLTAPPAARIAFVVLSVFLLLAPAGGAWAYYGDGETSSGNGLGAAALDFTLRDEGGAVTDTLFNESDVAPGPDWYVELLEIRKETGLDFDYEAWFEKTGGDNALCGELELKARQDGVLVYAGPLSAFARDAGVISGGFDDWSFEILFDNGDASFEGLSCEFDFVYRGEQIGGAGFYDEERVSNVFATGEWAQPGDVVINEVMWMGSTESGLDEWIELRNTTDQEIDVGQWEIENARAGGDPALMIPADETIPAGGYLLIAHWPETSANSALNVPVDVVNASISLADSGNGNLVLRDRYGNVVDEAKGDSWPEGYNSGGFKKSMERNDTPGDGTLAESWHTCEDEDGVGSDCNDGTFWDTADGDNFGTPGAANLSEGDPTSVEEESSGGDQEPVEGGEGSEDEVLDEEVKPEEIEDGKLEDEEDGAGEEDGEDEEGDGDEEPKDQAGDEEAVDEGGVEDGEEVGGDDGSDGDADGGDGEGGSADGETESNE